MATHVIPRQEAKLKAKISKVDEPLIRKPVDPKNQAFAKKGAVLLTIPKFPGGIELFPAYPWRVQFM